MLYLCNVKLYQYIVLIIFLVFSGETHAGKIEKGYEALVKFDYFSAKKAFYKGLKYNNSPAAQGLAIIYYRKDNPFHNLDSALRYIQLSIDGFDLVKDRKKEKYAVFGFTKDSLLNLRTLISSAEFLLRRKENTISSYQEFINIHTWAKEVAPAIYSRDSLAFFDAVHTNTSAAFQEFLTNYPESDFEVLARESYHEIKFTEETGDGSLRSFEDFVANNPGSPLVPDAQRRVYEMMTVSGTIPSFESFIQAHSDYPQIRLAWEELFQAFLVPYTEERMNAFNEKYPDHPISERVRTELERVGLLLLPIPRENKTDYLDKNGELVLSADVISGRYSEGLSIAQSNGKLGAIDVAGAVHIDFDYNGILPFNSGQAIVELNDKFGVIDRNGRVIMDPVFDDIGELVDGIRYASIGGVYGYYDRNGTNVIMHQFADAYDFTNGIGKVVFQEKEALIDKEGNYRVQPYFDEIKLFNDTLLAYAENGLWGLARYDCSKLTEAIFSFIGEQNNGIAAVIFEDRVVYIDHIGRVSIDQGFEVYPNFALQGSFKSGYAVVYKEGKYGRIDKDGKLVNKFKYDNIGNGEQQFTCMKEEFWGVSGNSDKVLISPKYNELFFVSDSLLIGKKDEFYGVINLSEASIVPFMFDEIDKLTNSCFIVKQNGYSGVNYKGELVLPIECNSVTMFDDLVLRLEIDGQIRYFDLTNKRMIGLDE